MKLLIFFTLLSFSAYAKNEGRYKFVPHEKNAWLDTLIDTNTGKMWRRICAYKDTSSNTIDGCVMHVWTEEDIIGLNATFEQIENRIKKMEAKKK